MSDRQFKKEAYIFTLSNASIISSSIKNNSDKQLSILKEKCKVQVYLSGEYPYSVRDPPARIGEALKIRGEASGFDEARNPGQFDARAYYHIKGVEYRLFNGEILERGRYYNGLREVLQCIREGISGIYEVSLKEGDSGVLKSMVLGDRTTLDSDIRGLYQRSGIAHALSISGLHVSILGYGLYRLLRKAGIHKIPAGIGSSVFLYLYSLMVGSGTATLRAVVMFITCVAADLLGRTYDLISALSLSLILILLSDPLFIEDSGFLLSFSAVLGIGIVKPWLDSFIPFHKNKIVSAVIVSLSVFLFTLPVTLYFFFQIPIYSIPLNLLLIPLLGILIVLALLLAIFGSITVYLGLPFAAGCHVILNIYEGACRFCEKLPHSSFIAGQPDLARITVYYSLLLCFIFLGINAKKRKLVILNTIAAMGLIIFMLIPLPHGLRIVMLDIGQGDSILLQCENGRTYLIDCGSSSEKNIAQYRVLPCLKALGIGQIDYGLMTHSDMDHISGFEEIFAMPEHERIPIKNLIMPDIGDTDEAYERLEKEAIEAGTDVIKVAAGGSWKEGDLLLSCMHPAKGFVAENANAYSTVLALQKGMFKALFTGDVEGDGEKALIEELHKEDDADITLLKVAHHGSRNSTSEEILGLLKPEIGLISCGEGNSYGHPHKELLERLDGVGTRHFSTAECGAIQVTIERGTLRIKTMINK